jgi:hypothetical protein
LSVKPLKLLRLAPEINIILCTCINVVLSKYLFDYRNYLCIMCKILPKFFFSRKGVQYKQ